MSKDKKFKLLLINPVPRHRRGLRMRIATTYPPVALGIVAALTPDNWDVKLIDENFDDFVFTEADLVAFTSFTASAPRVYELAAIYRQHNIKTVYGGVHASICTDEAINYVDVVVKGEAETVWTDVLSDFESNNLKQIYEGKRCDPVKFPMPRYDLYNKKYLFHGIVTSRGCPMNCDFCSVSVYSGTKQRFRDIDDILDEIEILPTKYFIFFDDNIIGYGKHGKERAIELFKGMVKRDIKKHWIAQATLQIANEPEVLKWAAKSGCKILFIGIEAEVSSSLKDAHKNLNLKIGVENYRKSFKKIHKYGMGVLGSFIFGFDSDTAKMLYDRGNFIIKSNVDTYQTTILTPLSGTPLYRRLKEEGRLLKTNYPGDWDYYNMREHVFKLNNMSCDEFINTMDDVWHKIYNRRTARWKFIRTLINTKSLLVAIWTYGSIYNYYNFVFEEEILAKNPKYYKWLKKYPKKYLQEKNRHN
ncbi:MAG: radical SAM protein [Lentimicrobiaceae bacterium]|nr:radical SAM protein [Lentimicrobiaceae bacterium]